MPVRIVTADERLSAAQNKTSIAIFGPPGAGKTSLLKTLRVYDRRRHSKERGRRANNNPADGKPSAGLPLSARAPCRRITRRDASGMQH
jgi:ribose 1,5-bisphosphokinase PhnN